MKVTECQLKWSPWATAGRVYWVTLPKGVDPSAQMVMRICLSPCLAVSGVLAFVGKLPRSAAWRPTFYQFSESSRQRGSLSGEFSQTLVLKSHVLSLGHVCISKPITKALLGLLQVQSQPLELRVAPAPCEPHRWRLRRSNSPKEHLPTKRRGKGSMAGENTGLLHS